MTGVGLKRLIQAAMIVLSVASGGVAHAQQSPAPSKAQAPVPVPAQPQPAQPPTAPAMDAPGVVVSAETKAARAKLDGYKADLDQKEVALQGRTMSDTELQNIRQQIEPVTANIRAVIDEQTPRLEASKQRLSQLGPKPAAGQPEESADVARDRTARSRPSSSSAGGRSASTSRRMSPRLAFTSVSISRSRPCAGDSAGTSRAASPALRPMAASAGPSPS